MPQIQITATVAEVPQDVVLEYERLFLRAMGIEITNEEIFPTVFSSPDRVRVKNVAQNVATFCCNRPGLEHKINLGIAKYGNMNRFISSEYDLVLLGGKNDAAL